MVKLTSAGSLVRSSNCKQGGLHSEQQAAGGLFLPPTIQTSQVCLCQRFQLLWPSGFVSKAKFKSRDHSLKKLNKSLFEQNHFINIGSSNVKCGSEKQLISNMKYLSSQMYLVNNLRPCTGLERIHTMSTKLQELLIIY